MNAIEPPRHTSISHLTRKGQVTIPAESRRRLGLKRGDRVAFVEDAGRVTLKPAESVVERTAGMLAPYRREPPLSAEAERSAAETAWAEERDRATGEQGRAEG